MTRLLFHIISYSAFLNRLSSLATELDITTQHRRQRKFKKSLTQTVACTQTLFYFSKWDNFSNILSKARWPIEDKQSYFFV